MNTKKIISLMLVSSVFFCFGMEEVVRKTQAKDPSCIADIMEVKKVTPIAISNDPAFSDCLEKQDGDACYDLITRMWDSYQRAKAKNGAQSKTFLSKLSLESRRLASEEEAQAINFWKTRYLIDNVSEMKPSEREGLQFKQDFLNRFTRHLYAELRGRCSSVECLRLVDKGALGQLSRKEYHRKARDDFSMFLDDIDHLDQIKYQLEKK